MDLHHKKLIERDPAEVDKLKQVFDIDRAFKGAIVVHLNIFHQSDGDCCRRESWEATIGHFCEIFAADGDSTEIIDSVCDFDPWNLPSAP